MISKKQKNLANALAQKANPISKHEINELKRAFEIKLAVHGKTQRQWCEENDMNQSTLSNGLNPERGGQRSVIALVARYVTDDTWV